MIFQDLDLQVLKTLVSNKKHAIEFCNECDAKLFPPEVWNFANITINYIKNYKDTPTRKILIEKFSKTDKNTEYINRIWDSLDNLTQDEKEFKLNVEKLKKRYSEKQLISFRDSLSKFESGSDISKTVSEMQRTIQSIKKLDELKTYDSKDIKEYIPSFVEKFNAKKTNPNLEAGIKTKYSFIDFATNGIKPADFIIIAGESGFGKSILLQNIALQTWLQDNTVDMISSFTVGKDIIYYSLEMPFEDCFNRFLSRLSGVPSRNIENAKLTKEQFQKVKKCLDFISKYPYKFKIVDIANACANDLEAILIDSGEKFDAIFIDYLGIMKPNEDGETQDWLKQGIISQEIRAIGRKYFIPVFSAVQLNRKSSKDSSEVIGLHRLARSATIATHATLVIQIESQASDNNFSFIYHIIKNRKGPKGKGALIKDLPCATLLDVPITEEIGEQQIASEIDISDKLANLDSL